GGPECGGSSVCVRGWDRSRRRRPSLRRSACLVGAARSITVAQLTASAEPGGANLAQCLLSQLLCHPLIFLKGALEIFAAICAPPPLTNLAFPRCQVPPFFERLLGDARKIAMVADLYAEFICKQEQRDREE